MTVLTSCIDFHLVAVFYVPKMMRHCLLMVLNYLLDRVLGTLFANSILSAPVIGILVAIFLIEMNKFIEFE